MKSRIVFVDDEGQAPDAVSNALKSAGFELARLSVAAYLNGSLTKQVDDLLVLGHCGNRLDAVLDNIKNCRQPFCWYDSDRSARLTPALKRIVCGTLPVPLPEKQLQRVLARVERVQSRLAVATMKTSTATKNTPAKESGSVIRLAGSSQAMANIRELISQVAPTDATVLILGETGTGKEVVAKNIHAASVRAGKPFVAVNCGAIPSELLESELFGHEKGAFTGALTSRQGRFEMAEGGSLFLDEIGDMPLMMQVKLLRVLQERCFERVGSNRTLGCDVRVIAATHQNLEARIAEGNFRQDLYYRLNVFPVEIPALRDRRDDVAELIAELIQRMAACGRETIQFTDAAMAMVAGYDWPGNIRELANVLERLAIMYPGQTIDIDRLPRAVRRDSEPIPALASIAATSQPQPSLDLGARVANLERGLIEEALQRAEGDLEVAAQLLNLDVPTLQEKISKQQGSPL